MVRTLSWWGSNESMDLHTKLKSEELMNTHAGEWSKIWSKIS